MSNTAVYIFIVWTKNIPPSMWGTRAESHHASSDLLTTHSYGVCCGTIVDDTVESRKMVSCFSGDKESQLPHRSGPFLLHSQYSSTRLPSPWSQLILPLFQNEADVMVKGKQTLGRHSLGSNTGSSINYLWPLASCSMRLLWGLST
jgi:hypothetical protein